jgi:hypothetical protein
LWCCCLVPQEKKITNGSQLRLLLCGVRKRELSHRFFFSSLFIFHLFILFLASIHHRISLLLLFLSFFSHTVNQPLYICVWPCTTIYWLSLCYVLHSGRSFASPSLLFLLLFYVRLLSWTWMNKRRGQKHIKLIVLYAGQSLSRLVLFLDIKIIIKSVSKWEK